MRKRKAELRVRIDEGIMEALKEIAGEEGRTVSELVREAIAWLIRDRELAREIKELTSEDASLSGQRVALLRGHIQSGELLEHYLKRKREREDVGDGEERNDSGQSAPYPGKRDGQKP